MAGPQMVAMAQSAARPCAPSWVDRLQDSLERSPTRLAAFYVGMPVALFVAIAAAHWWDGTVPVGRLHPFHAVPPATLALSLAFMHWLDRHAVMSLRAFRPALRLSDAEVDALGFRLTHLPARETRHAGMWGVATSRHRARAPYVGLSRPAGARGPARRVKR